MAIYVSMTATADDGTERRYLHCYWDESSSRPASLEEARDYAENRIGHDVEIALDLGTGERPRDQGWAVSAEGLWICPTHAKELPP